MMEIADYTSIHPDSMQRNVGNLLTMAQVVYPLKEARDLRCDVLTRNFVIEFRRQRRMRKGISPKGDLRHNYSLNSTLRQAQSVFSKAARENLYGELHLPDLKGFLGVSKLKVHKTHYTPIEPDLLEQMEQEARTKLRTENPRLFIIFEMAFYLGMRSAEILAARWHWIEKQKGWYQLGVVARPAGTPSAEVQDFAPKSRDRWIPVSEKRVKDWKELYPPKKAWDYIVPGGALKQIGGK